MGDNEGGFLGPVLKYLVLPITLIGIAWYAVTRLFGFGNGEAARRDAEEQIAKIWEEYDSEYKDFWEKGYLTPEEYNILQSKLGLLAPPIQAIADSVPEGADFNYLGTILIGSVVGVVTIFELLKHAGSIGQNLREFWNSVKGNTPKEGSVGTQISGYELDWTYATKEELGLLFDISAAMDIADAGNVNLAATMMNSTETNYFNNILPQMQTSYNMLSAQLPLLQGMQLVLATYMMAQYLVYIQTFPTVLPPLIGVLPPPI